MDIPRREPLGKNKSYWFSMACAERSKSRISAPERPVMGELNTFPVSYKVQGQRIVIIGGGEEALNKARLLNKTTASVVIVCDEPSVSFHGISHELVQAAAMVAALDGTALVFVAEESATADAAKVEARRRGIPVNVVDKPDECDFYVPSIVDRAPLTVAVSTEGDAPVLARLVRARIEAMLAPELGGVARLAGSLRARVASVLNKVQARRFYEDLVISDEPDVETLLDKHARDEAGVVWLIGAGPGSEDLLTLRAQRLLQEADVVV
ncbi:MAG: siroheme synthase, partial [Devosia sp.]